MVAIFGFSSVKNIRIALNFNRERAPPSPTSIVRIMHLMYHTKCTDLAEASTCFPLNSKANRELVGVGYTQRSCENLVQIHNRKDLKVNL